MKKRAADIVVDCLIQNGITDCFSVVGGGAMHLNHAFALRDEIHKIYCHHEQACAMAAESYAKISGKIAVVCVTSGPGGLNTLNGVQGAYVDNTPMLILSGHPRYTTTVAYTGLHLRYRGVQEFDIVNTVKTMTKYSKLICDSKEIKREIENAISIAMEGRKGPVWLDIPLDIQSVLIEEEELYKTEGRDKKEKSEEVSKIMNSIMDQMDLAKRPCILTGSGIRSSNSIEKFRVFAKALGVPVVGGALQADIMCEENPLYYGISGTVGERCGNFILQNSDLILVIGNSLSFKQTGFRQEMFAPSAKIIMIDIEEDESKKPGLHIEQFFKYNLTYFFDDVMGLVRKINVEKSWIDYCNRVRERFPRFEPLCYINSDMEGVSAVEFWKEFLENAEKDAVFALGNSSCVAPLLVFGTEKEEQRVIVNYNSGSMGDDIPEAVGAAVALQKPVYCITGDGSVMMNLQELQTVIYSKLPIKLILFSNHGYGAIRRTCKNFFHGRYAGCDESSGISMPEFEKIAYGFQIPYYKCESSCQLAETINWIKTQKSFCIVEIKQKEEDVIYPRLLSKMNPDGTFLDPELQDMSPFLSEEEMAQWMIRERKG